MVVEDSTTRKSAVPDSLLYAENTFKEIFDGMAQVYERQGEVKRAIVYYEKSFYVEELLQRSFSYRKVILLHQAENRRRAERVITLLYTLYQKTSNGRYIEKAFKVAERTKAITLKDELLSQQASMVSDSIVKTKNHLERRLAVIENALILEQQKGDRADISSIHRLIDQKNEISLNLKQLNKTLRITPINMISIDSLQTNLTEDNAKLIEYFFGDEALYTFFVNGRSIQLQKNTNIDSLRKWMVRYTGFFSSAENINMDQDLFAETSNKLYKAIVPKQPFSKLIIVPDGLLNFVPFETLLSYVPSTFNYANWPWLINKSSVMYQHTASLYNKPSDTKHKVPELLGMFPSFENSDRFLKYSSEEAEQIKRHFKGDFFSDRLADKATFLKKAPEYQVIHLSTHASAGGINEPPSISFIDSTLYLPEIYGLDLNTQLMVLGACETGIGKLYKGEGPLSLANGFLHAGVNGIVMSLWRVNDYSTAQLMADFYKHYDNNTQPSMALHQSKLDYLQNRKIAPDKKSPYYWASFVYYGDSKALNNEDPNAIWYILTTVFGIVLASAVSYRMRA